MAQSLPGGEVHGNFELNAQYYTADSSINAPVVPEKALMNSFANIIYTNNNFTAGARFESYLNTMQGFDPRYNNTGVPFRYVSYNLDGLEITAGNFYEQFGSGLIFRSYEERGLGLDNAMNGVRVRYAPWKGVQLKGVWGKQRTYWTNGPGIVRGIDADFSLNDMFACMAEQKTRIQVGGSFVSKYQKDQDPLYNLPENVGAGAARINITRGKITLSGEYASKINDPSYVNNFIYRPGQALLLNASYSKKGMGINVSAKRIDNMNYRSDVNATRTDLNINYLPALTKQHTYQLAAIYPYATQPNGEFGMQGEFIYTFKKETPFGGKYGTTVALNYSRAQAIDHSAPADTSAIGVAGTYGYRSDFLKFGKQVYFEDVNVEITKKFSPKFHAALSYLYITYNKDVIQGTPGYGTIYSHIGVLETHYKFTETHTLRSEFQHLYTKQDQKSWAMVLMEYTVAPHWFVAALDLYNYGNPVASKQVHYYNFSGGYSKNTMRFSLGYGKQREGIFCVGGVCRTVPASNGLTFSITSSF